MEMVCRANDRNQGEQRAQYQTVLIGQPAEAPMMPLRSGGFSNLFQRGCDIVFLRDVTSL